MALMARDKKALDGLTFVLDGPDGVEVVAGVPEAAVRSAPRRVRRPWRLTRAGVTHRSITLDDVADDPGAPAARQRL